MHEEVTYQQEGLTARKRLDLRHEALAKLIAENERDGAGRSMKEMMIAVGYSASTAHSMAQRTLNSASMREVMEANGLTRDRVSRVIEEAMAAKTVAVYKGSAKETSAPDHKTRLAAASLYGDFTGEKKRTVDVRTLNVDVPKEAVLHLLGIEPAE